MRFKKIMILTIILVSLLAVSSVSASENATSDVVGADATDEVVTVEETTEGVDDNNTLLCIENDEELPLSAINLDKISIDLWTNDYYYEYDDNGYDISAWIYNITYVDNADYYLNLQIYDQNNKLVFNSTKEVVKSYYYDDMTNFNVKLTGGSYTTILTAKKISSYGTEYSKSFKYTIYLETKEEYEAYLYEDVPDDIYAEPVKFKAPSVKVKVKANNYFKVKATYESGYPIKYEYVKIKVWTGKKTKNYYSKTNSKGIASFNTKKLSLGTHKVKVSMFDTDYFKGAKYTKIIVKKKLAPTVVKTTTKKKTNIATVKNGKYGNYNYLMLTIKDGKKTIKVKCIYKKSFKQYLGHTYKYGKRYSAYIAYEYKDGMQGGKKGWWTSATNAGMADGAKTGWKYNKYCPVTKITLH